ncbi:SUMF1/EgtB/PvdO family nonheme iron enzyme [Streptomyces sp. NA02950]|uniref:formylglycine-generating enzyme family protein n=1 Tax=Streptomyces sp. NA02950 TaxID=2742137 RepID=UPI0015906D85|nr:SUMF1/EgtB/PvdO family nonheme iron enzyme [Streptomyces sp. NA02950]QKV96368.1 SUMF1/EgtB/PvdO family nonheme iron enzyme [Streptomyces sp. NA02950]
MTTYDSPPSADMPCFVEVPAGELPSSGAAPVRTPGFRLAALPITIGQYWHYLVAQGLREKPRPELHAFPTGHGTGLRAAPPGAVTLDEELSGLPVTRVTWRGAVAYCDWLTVRTGAHCRLPSAAEWQYAAAGPERLRWSLGNEFDRATYAPQASGPRPVGATPANAFGLRDLTGNVFEWCEDELTTPSGEGLGSRVIKGGAYTVRNPESFENATAFTADELSTVPYIGFRVLCARTRPAPTGSPA